MLFIQKHNWQIAFNAKISQSNLVCVWCCSYSQQSVSSVTFKLQFFLGLMIPLLHKMSSPDVTALGFLDLSSKPRSVHLYALQACALRSLWWKFGWCHWHEPHSCDFQLTQEMIQKATCFIVVSSVCWLGDVYSPCCHSRVLAESERSYINVDTMDCFQHIHTFMEALKTLCMFNFSNTSVTFI